MKFLQKISLIKCEINGTTYNPISRQPIAMERLGEELNREPAALGGSTTVFQAQAEVRTQTQPAQSGGMFSRLGFGGS